MSNDEKTTNLLRPQEAAQLLAISKRTLWDLTQSGAIPCVRIKRAVRYSQSDLIAYIKRQREPLNRSINNT